MRRLQGKTVLVVANDFTTIHHFRMELLEALIAEDAEVVLALPDDERNAAFSQSGVQVMPIPLSRFGTNPFADIRAMLAIRRLIRRLRPSFVLTYTAKPNIYGGLACTLEGVDYAATVTGLGKNFESGNLISKIMLVLERVALFRAKVVFFQNKSNRDLLQRNGIARHNARMIAGSGVNLQTNAYAPYPHNRVTKFLTVARIRKDKGYDELFAAIRRLRDQCIPAEFHIVGWYEDEAYKPVVEEMQERFQVHIHNYVSHDEIQKFYRQSDCLIQPSHHEGMSNVILEAAATGRPCIVSDIPGCREGIIDGGTGFLFRVRDAEDLYHRMREFMKLNREMRQMMGLAARALMEDQFDRFKVVEEYVRTLL